MSKSPSKSKPSGYPEYAVRAEIIRRFFSPTLPSSTFHDFVKKGKIIPLKDIRGLFKLNESLRRLGLREVPELPQALPKRTNEEIVRMAFSLIDPDLFPAPSWLLNAEAIENTDAHHAELILARHAEPVAGLENDRLKLAYLQGVLDAAASTEAEHAIGGP